MIALPLSSKMMAGITFTQSGHNDCVLFGSPVGSSLIKAPVRVISGCRIWKSGRLEAGKSGAAADCVRNGGTGEKVWVLKAHLQHQVVPGASGTHVPHTSRR